MQWIKQTKLIRRLSPQTRERFARVERALVNRYSYETFSQAGEDIILRHCLDINRTGFYVDVGAHHPKDLSNTYYFYSHGWRGINIDAMPGSMEAFARIRPRDINLEMGVTSTDGEMTFHVFDFPALNTFDSETAIQQRERGFKEVRRQTVKTLPLARILDLHLPVGQAISFLSVDVEGLDLAVLQSNDWTHYRPSFVLVECLDFDLNHPEGSPIYSFLRTQGYFVFAKTRYNVLFVTNS